MKDIIQKLKENYKWGLIVFALGLLLGWFILPSPGNKGNTPQTESVEASEAVEEDITWTCSMHPQIRRDEPGQCPICGMDLIPVSELSSDEAFVHPDEIQMTESAVKLAEIQTYVVNEGMPRKEIYLQGKVQPDERKIAQLTARFGGRIENLHISFTGEQVKKGEKLATIYSPELVTAQRELLEAYRNKDVRPSLYQAARSKLQLWDLLEEQIDEIEKSGKPKLYFDILSPISGTVMERNIATGDYVEEGAPMFEVIDLRNLWILFDAYETDLPWISLGDKVTYTVQSLPGKTFTGKVTYIDPFIRPDSRVAKVRVQQSNPGLLLKPEMFVKGYLESTIAESGDEILIPKSAVLWTGKRAIVYVLVPERNTPTFQFREIELGPESGDFYVVEKGLEPGNEIAENGVFKIDAAAQLAGKYSMMNPPGDNAMEDHDGGMIMVAGAQVDPEFQDKLRSVYVEYLTLKNALVKSDPDAASTAAASMNADLNSIGMDLISGNAHDIWMPLEEQMNKNLQQLVGSDDIDVQRKAFSNISDALYRSIKRLVPGDMGTIYYQYCPMAFDDQGAYWLSELEEINNPYFGDMMLRCGETREILK